MLSEVLDQVAFFFSSFLFFFNGLHIMC
jgi:hypothetical protein